MHKPLPVLLLSVSAGIVSFSMPFAIPEAFALPTAGEPVAMIPYANEITRFETIDNQHLLVSVDPERTYVLEFKEQCHHLSFARHIGVSMANNTIWAGFDYVTADGAQCTIDSIQKLTTKTLAPVKS